MNSHSQGTSQGSSKGTSGNPGTLQIPARAYTGRPGSPGSPPPQKHNASDSQHLVKRAGTSTGATAKDGANADGDKASSGAWMRAAIRLGGHDGKEPSARPRTPIPDDTQDQ